MTTIYDVLIYGMPAVGVIFGIFLEKWIEERNMDKKMKREIYLEANRSLSRYRDIYLAYALNMNEVNMSRLHEQQMLSENAKSDLEIIGSDEAVKIYSECFRFIEKAGEEVLDKKETGETLIGIAKKVNNIPSYKEFLNLWPKWNIIVRKDLKLIK